MRTKASSILVFTGLSASFFAWGEIWGTCVLALYAMFCLLPSPDDKRSLSNYLEIALMISVMGLGSLAIGFVTPGEIFGVRLGLLSSIAALAIHISFWLRPE